MKQRIISGAIMAAVVLLVLILGLTLDNLIIITFVAIIAALGVYELVCNAAKVDNIILKVLSALYTVVMTFMFCTINENLYKLNNTSYDVLEIEALVIAVVVSVIYVIVVGILILVFQKDLDLAKITTLCGMPIIYSFAFSTIASIIVATSGIYYLLLALNFASICDMGAYFVGVSMGKTKLCPEISPKKTVEGALGGIACSLIASLIITLCFGYFDKILPALLFTVPLCVIGMSGDLFASIIKRKVCLKDYGNLIPGHGGVLDRVDSLLFISPVLYSLMLLGIFK